MKNSRKKRIPLDIDTLETIKDNIFYELKQQLSPHETLDIICNLFAEYFRNTEKHSSDEIQHLFASLLEHVGTESNIPAKFTITYEIQNEN